jgi:thioredoxin
MIVTVSDDTFEELVLRAPCKMIKSVLRELADELAGRLVVAELDVDANPRTARAAGVLGMPTLNVYVDGRVATQVVGARPKAALLRAIAEHLPVTAG